MEFFTTSSRNLLAAERDAGVAHHMAVSIVGAMRLPDSGYLLAKVAQEAEIEDGSIPHTILRATPFFEFPRQIVESGAENHSVRLSTGLIQFVAADDVAATVAELAISAPVGGHVELGGPEAQPESAAPTPLTSDNPPQAVWTVRSLLVYRREGTFDLTAAFGREPAACRCDHFRRIRRRTPPLRHLLCPCQEHLCRDCDSPAERGHHDRRGRGLCLVQSAARDGELRLRACPR